jgi:hypothetical protein
MVGLKLLEVFAGGTEKSHENVSVAGVLAEILRKHLANTRLDSYRYDDPFVPFALL